MHITHVPSPPRYSNDMRDSNYQAALAFVNQLREQNGAKPIPELRPGRMANACKCPISQSLQDAVKGQVSTCAAFVSITDDFGYQKEFYATDPQTSDFIHNFDQGHYPSLLQL